MWYDDIRYASPKVETDPHGLFFKEVEVPQGAPIKFKATRGTFLYGVVAENIETGSKWIDCRELTGRKAGKWRSFPFEKFKQQVIPRKKRAYKKRAK